MITDLRKCKKCCADVRNKNERNHYADTKVSEEGREEVLQLPEQRFLAAHGEDHGDAGCQTAACGGPHARAGGCNLKDDEFQFALISHSTVFN